MQFSLRKEKKKHPKTKAHNLKRKRHTILATILGYDFLMTSQNCKNKIVTQNRRKTSFQKPIFQRGFPTILGYDFILRFSSRHNNIPTPRVCTHSDSDSSQAYYLPAKKIVSKSYFLKSQETAIGIRFWTTDRNRNQKS